MTANLFTLAAEPLPSPAPAPIPREVSRAARVLQGERKRQRAIRQVEENADADWMKAAEKTIRWYAALGDRFTSDDIWANLEKMNLTTHEPRALGAIFNRLARQGVIEQTGEYRKSVRPECHRNPKAVWRGAGQ
jgi:hypothetical protein